MHAVLASLAPFASLASLSSSSMLLACCSLISLASLPCCCSPCPCRSPARLLGLLASLACSARFARCCLLLSRSLRLPAAAPTRFARLRPADVHLAATSPAAYSPRSLAVLASLAPSRFARSLLAHCSLTARSLLAHCSRFARLTARLTPRFPCAMIALPPAVENCVVTVRNPYRTPTHTLFAPLYPFLSLTPPG